MKTCPNCGRQLPADAAFCTSCGSPIYREPPQAEEPQPKSGKSKAPLFIAAAAIALVLIAAAVLMVPRLFSSPEKTFVSAQEDLFITPLLAALESGMDTYGSGKLSTDMTFSASVDSDGINRYLSDSSVVLKLDIDRDKLLADGGLVLIGSPVLSGTLTYEEGALGFYLPELDDHYYVADLSGLLSAMGMEDVELSDIKAPEFSGREWRALAQTYLDLVYTVVTKDNVTAAQRQGFSLPELGGSYTGTVYTFTPTAADVGAMLEKLADHLENDRDLRSLIKKLADSGALQDILSSSMGYEDLDTALDEALGKAAADLRKEAGFLNGSVQAEVSGTPHYEGITWTLYMEGKEVRMVRLENSYGSAMVFERAGTQSKGCAQMLYEESDDGNVVYFESEYTKNGSVYDGTVTLHGDYSYDSVSVSCNVDTGKLSVLGVPYGSYSLYVPYEDVSLSLEVSEGSSGSTDHVITIQGGGYMFDGMFTRLDLTVNTTGKSSAQKPGQPPTDISDYSEAELDELFYGLVYRMGGELYALLYELR